MCHPVSVDNFGINLGENLPYSIIKYWKNKLNTPHMPREGMLSLGSMTLKTDSWVLTYGP